MRPMFGRACDSPGDVRALQVTWGVRADLQETYVRFRSPGACVRISRIFFFSLDRGRACMRPTKVGRVFVSSVQETCVRSRGVRADLQHSIFND